jgi:H+/Cl- antiporter ClcA
MGLDLIAQKRDVINLYWLLLPLVGILFQFSKNRWSALHSIGTNDYLELIQKKEKKTSAFFSIYILITTWISHLAGASVGREGTAVQMGASLSDQIATRFSFSKEEKAIWIRAGMAAGFASVFGTPWAGTFFGLEINKVGSLSIKSILPCLITSFMANWISLHVYGTNHTVYPSISLPPPNIQFWLHIIILSLFLGLIGFIYKALESNIYKWADRLSTHFILKGIIFGLILYFILTSKFFETCIGLGSEKLLEPFSNNFENQFFLKKILSTSISIGLGYRGGEATPLFLIGSHAGAFISNYISLPIQLSAGIGFVALYCGLAKTPLTGMFLGIELFSPQAWFLYLVTTVIVIYFSGKHGLFSKQEWSDQLPKPLF